MSGLFSWDRFTAAARQVFPYLPVTFEIVAIATIGGIILGLLVAFVRLKKPPVLYQICTVYISFMRGTPMLVQLFLIMYGLPIFINPIFGLNIGRTWDKIYFAYVTFVLNQGAFLSSIFYTAIKAVPIGQIEAGYSVGLTELQTMVRIVFPQAIKTAIPPFGVDFVCLFQNVSLVFSIGVIDLMGRANAFGSAQGHMLEGYVFVAIVYIIISFIMRIAFDWLNRAVTYGKKAKT